jgi:hypothetical protein
MSERLTYQVLHACLSEDEVRTSVRIQVEFGARRQHRHTV